MHFTFCAPGMHFEFLELRTLCYISKTDEWIVFCEVYTQGRDEV